MRELTPCDGIMTAIPDTTSASVSAMLSAVSRGENCTSCSYSHLCSTLYPPKTVEVLAFTGMKIGTFEMFENKETTITVQTKTGEILEFDKATGMQLNAKNPKYPNKIRIN